jgi:hypothetical protein
MQWSWQGNLAAFAVLLLGSSSSAHAQSPAAKVVKFKLEDYGWRPLPRQQPGERAGTRSQLVSIDHNGRVLAAFAAREDAGLATREHPELSLHILRLTSEGKIDLSLALPTREYFGNGFYLGQDDRIFARANDELQVLSGEDNARPEGASWRSLAQCSRNCRIHQSPSRRTLIISESKGDSGRSSLWPTNDSTYTIFDTSSEPQVLRTCTNMGDYGEKITDQFAYWPNYDRDDNRTVRFPFCDVDHFQELSLTGGGGFFPLRDDAFLLLEGEFKNSPGKVQLVGSDARVKFRQEMPKYDTPQYYAGFWATSDERGDRFAFIVDTRRGGSRSFDISGKLVARRIVVYSESGEELASIPVSTADHRDFDFSLSPDGHRLAILDEDVVTVIEIP